MSTGVSSVARVIVVGAAGRLGSRVCALAGADESFALVGALARPGSASVGREAAPARAGASAVMIGADVRAFGAGAADVVVGVATGSGVEAALETSRRVGCGVLVCTTGLTEGAVQSLKAESQRRAVLLAPNTSAGVAVAADLVRRAAGALRGYSCSIVEAHHSQKKDAPSGTALRLAAAAREGGATLGAEQVLSIRGGDVIGEHTIRLAGAGEYLEITHRATSRDLFARGALVCAAWLKGRAAGWWTVEDVLGLGAK